MKYSTKLKLNNKDIEKKFYGMINSSDLAELFEVDLKFLTFLLYGKEKRNNQYKTFEIVKKSGGRRKICAPIDSLKIIQKKLNHVLNIVYSPRVSAHGFIMKRSIVTNASKHINKKIVLNLDLKDFFPSINYGRVYGLFLKKPYEFSQEVAANLAKICTHDNQLPQGSPTSPIISNMICHRLDGQLQKLAHRYNCIYTRYADDITFSSNKETFNPVIAKIDFKPNEGKIFIGNLLSKIIEDNGFEINNDKIRLNYYLRRQTVTGLKVNRIVNVDRKMIRKINSMLHIWNRYGIANAESRFIKKYATKKYLGKDVFLRVLKGNIDFVKNVKGDDSYVYAKLINKFNRLSNKYFPELPTSENESIFFPLWIVNSSRKQGTGFMLDGVGIITCAHVIEDENVHVFKYNDWMNTIEAKLIYIDREKDVAILEIDTPKRYDAPQYKYKIGNERFISHGSHIGIAGFPQYKKGDMPTIIKDCEIINMILDNHANRTWIIKDSVFDGNSGGPVLNRNNEVVGIIKYGSDDADPKIVKKIYQYGFISINDALGKFLKKQKIISLTKLLRRRINL